MYCFPKVIKKVKDRRQKGKTKGENASLQFKKTKVSASKLTKKSCQSLKLSNFA